MIICFLANFLCCNNGSTVGLNGHILFRFYNIPFIWIPRATMTVSKIRFSDSERSNLKFHYYFRNFTKIEQFCWCHCCIWTEDIKAWDKTGELNIHSPVSQLWKHKRKLGSRKYLASLRIIACKRSHWTERHRSTLEETGWKRTDRPRTRETTGRTGTPQTVTQLPFHTSPWT
jgi:hypothetical protein